MSDIIVIGARGIPNVEGGAEKNAEKLFPLIARAGYSVEFVGLQEYIKSPSYEGVKLTRVPTTSFFKTDKVVYNLFIEPQFSIALRGVGLPAVQIFAGVNLQFKTSGKNKKKQAARLMNQLRAEHSMRTRMQ